MTSGELSVPIRMNRLTGYTEYFDGGNWNPEKGRKEHKPTQVLPPNQEARITGNASLSFGSFSGKIYNGSDWTETGRTFRVVAKEQGWERKVGQEIQIIFFNCILQGVATSEYRRSFVLLAKIQILQIGLRRCGKAH